MSTSHYMPHMKPLVSVHACLTLPSCAVCSVKGGGCFKASEWGGALIEEMKPAAGDVVVEGKWVLRCGVTHLTV